MQVNFGEHAHLGQAIAILGSNLEEAWGEMEKFPREWGLGEEEGNIALVIDI